MSRPTPKNAMSETKFYRSRSPFRSVVEIAEFFYGATQIRCENIDVRPNSGVVAELVKIVV